MILRRIYNLLILILITLGFQALAQEPQDGAGWFAAAQEARAAGDLEAASEALEKASAGGFAPVRVSFESARLLTLGGNGDAAAAVLQGLADNGFTAVAFITGDPILSRLAGNAAFDRLVADMSARAYPCESDEAFRAFDFWVGEWVVHGPAGALAGTNTIRRAERGCVLIENWTSASGGTGMSINYLDHSTGEWVQVWHAEGGSQIHIRGGMTDEGMRLVGELHEVGTNTTAPFRGLWTPLEDGRVRQYFEQSADGGETWLPWFEGFYTRQE
jgi:hypothetical protein